MKVLDIKFSDADVLEVVSFGNPAYSWVGLKNRPEIGNFYKTFSVVPNNMGPLDKLLFKVYEIGNTPQEDKVGPTYQATHLHVPLLHCHGAEAGEYVSGFNIENSHKVLEDFGQLLGLQGSNWLGDRVIFSESSTFPSTMPTDSDSEIYEVNHEKGELPKEIPSELMSLVKSGHQLFWLRHTRKYYPYSIHFLFNSKMYFTEKTDRLNVKHRALYFLEAMLPKRSDDVFTGRHMIVGFGVSHDSGKHQRGFGTLNILSADQVDFLPTA